MLFFECTGGNHATVGFGLLSYHFLLFDGSLRILRKTGIAYENTFVDARGSKKLELALKPDLIAAGINDVIGDVSKSIEKETNWWVNFDSHTSDANHYRLSFNAK